jgi:C-terminal processing protease CtpA/Prc
MRGMRLGPGELRFIPRSLRASAALLLLAVFMGTGIAAAVPDSLQHREEDFDFLWSEIGASYAYFDKKSTDWDKVKTLYRPQLANVTNRDEFIGLLEKVLEELYDSHAHLNTNTATSPKLIPSGTDLWAAWDGDRAFITQVRAGSPAERAGLKAGTEIFGIDGVAVREAVDRRVGRSLRAPDPAARDWSLRAVLTGRHGQTRRIVAQTGRTRGQFVLEDPEQDRAAAPRDARRLHHERLPQDRTIGYIRIHNSLGSMELLKDFDTSLRELDGTAGLILDLRDTPSGGNTTVARGIMGRFLEREGFYQKHSLPEEERTQGVPRSWMEIVSPRGARLYAAPVVVLVDHWTGSMGEGIAIGMDGLKRATVVGTRMAELLGATHQITLPNSGIGVSFPAEKLFHVNGTPREDFVPPVHVDLLKPEHQKVRDPILEAGLRTLRAGIRDGVSK